MAKKTSIQNPRPCLLKHGEMFVKETYMRLHRQKHGLTTNEAEAKFNDELKKGKITLYKLQGDVKIYRNQNK